MRSYGLFQVFMPIPIVCNATHCYLLLRYPWLLFTFRTTRAFVGGCALTSVACGMVLLQAYSCCATYLWTRGRECRPQVCLPFDAYKLTQERVHGRQHQHSYMYVYGWWGGAGDTNRWVGLGRHKRSRIGSEMQGGFCEDRFRLFFEH